MAALSVDGIIGPFFLEDADGNVVWFQQDGATPHTAGDVVDWLSQTFGDRFISFRTEREWPPHSPDLNPLDFFLWGHLKERVYTPTPENTDELKAAIGREMRKISREVCKNVIDNFKQRISIIIRQNGRHIEHML